VLQTAEVFARGQEALAAAVGASEFEISAALRILEREGLIELQAPGAGAYTIKVLDPNAELHSRSAKGLLASLRAEAGAGGTLSVSLRGLSGRAGLPEKDLRRALSALERAKAISVRKPFAGRGIRALQRVPFHALDLSLERVRRQERRALLLLRRMTDYAYARACRRAFVLDYFGEDTRHLDCNGCDVCSGQRTRIELPPPRSTGKAGGIYKSKERVAEGPMNDQAAEALRRFRRDLSRDLDLPPFILFTDKTLQALATALPLTREDFLAVKGTGATSWERFGPQVVEICRGARETAETVESGAGAGRRS